jgi:type IV pilus assembly protein PilB
MTKEEIANIREEERTTRKLAERYHVPTINLENEVLDRNLVQSIPVEFLHRLNFVPLEDAGDVMKIAVADPSDIAGIDAIEAFLGKKVQVYAASRRAIQEALRKSETAMQVLKEATEGFITQVVERESGEEEDVISVEKLADQDGSIIKLVHTIILTAVQKRASDIHIESKDRKSVV